MRNLILGLCGIILSLTAGCSREPTLPGGGSHKIEQISFFIQERDSRHPAESPLKLHVGDRLSLRIIAHWAIPSQTDVTEQAILTLSDPNAATLDAQGNLKATHAGHLVLTAVLRVAQRGEDHVVLSPTQSAAPDSAVALTSEQTILIEQ